jgi:hypothetical protein
MGGSGSRAETWPRGIRRGSAVVFPPRPRPRPLRSVDRQGLLAVRRQEKWAERARARAARAARWAGSSARRRRAATSSAGSSRPKASPPSPGPPAGWWRGPPGSGSRRPWPRTAAGRSPRAAGADESQRLGVEGRQLGLLDPAQQEDPAGQAQRLGQRAELGPLLVAAPGQDQAHPRRRRGGEGPHQEREVLAPLPAADVEQVRPVQAVPPPRPVAVGLRHRRVEARVGRLRRHGDPPGGDPQPADQLAPGVPADGDDPLGARPGDPARGPHRQLPRAGNRRRGPPAARRRRRPGRWRRAASAPGDRGWPRAGRSGTASGAGRPGRPRTAAAATTAPTPRAASPGRRPRGSPPPAAGPGGRRAAAGPRRGPARRPARPARPAGCWRSGSTPATTGRAADGR